MNKDDKARVAELKTKLESLKSEVEAVGSELRTLADAEQEKFDNMPDGLQQGDAGQAIENAAQQLDEAAGSAEDGDLLASIDAIEQIEL